MYLRLIKNPKELNHNLIKATQARHTLDLIWGAALTRFFSLTLSKKFVRVISIGRYKLQFYSYYIKDINRLQSLNLKSIILDTLQ
jgi:DNA topoisomerase-1